ncbi:MAG: hypothetical protein UV47_C0008G0001 [Parcubacteria group bacterium GW2011_GWA2_42_80]|nr:MAG: hypothetical protein UV47_C0008G0001 [Parcubacteria group bacterium GW2011_GWA2_42_80]
MSDKSAIAEAGLAIKSEETSGLLVTCKIPLYLLELDASRKAAFTCALVTFFRFRTKVKSDKETQTVGTRTAKPSKIPLSSGMVSVVAIAAPVVVGTIFCAAARARRKSLCGPSTKF